MKKNKSSVFVVTTGDQDGIGPEVTYKALSLLGSQPNTSFVIFRSRKVSPSLLRLVDNRFQRNQFDSLEDALSNTVRPENLCEVVSAEPPPKWVYQSAKYALSGKVAGLITAPLSKTLILSSGFKERGHTEILQKVSRAPHVTMSFWGPEFSVALGSIHIPLSKVVKSFSPQSIEAHLTNIIHHFPRPKRRKLRVGVLGINPHAGEAGLIGIEEQSVLSPTLKKMRQLFPSVMFSDPLVPDAAFLKGQSCKYDVFFCPYHDQGLIPFKLVHGQSRGCQISLGLPFIRTSVDHGTAKDIFGKNLADPGSMKDALLQAINLYRDKKTSKSTLF